MYLPSPLPIARPPRRLSTGLPARHVKSTSVSRQFRSRDDDPGACEKGGPRRQPPEQPACREANNRTRRYALPIIMPAANTISPPTTTSNTACRNFVSMYLARIQAITHSSITTTMIANVVATLKFEIR